MTAESSELSWLVEQTSEVRDPDAFVPLLLEHLAERLGTDLAAADVDTGKGTLTFHHHVRGPTDAGRLPDVRRLMHDATDVAPTDLVHRFRLSRASGVLYLADVPPERHEAAAQDADRALALLDLLADVQDAHRQADLDPLTELSNRRAMRRSLGRAIAEGNRYTDRTFSVVMIDLNNFKWFNDTFGHPAGDDLLRAMADVLRTSVREADMAARWGGDEFLLLLPETDPDQAAVMLERVTTELEDFLRHRRQEGVKLGFSAGVAYFPSDGRNADTLVGRADERLYQAKREVPTPSMWEGA